MQLGLSCAGSGFLARVPCLLKFLKEYDKSVVRQVPFSGIFIQGQVELLGEFRCSRSRKNSETPTNLQPWFSKARARGIWKDTAPATAGRRGIGKRRGFAACGLL